MTRDYNFKIDPDTLAASITMPTFEKVARDVSATIADDFDGKVRSALIKLGWTPPEGRSGGLSDIMFERYRQIAVEGWTTTHDDGHAHGELARAAASYAYGSTIGKGSRPHWFPADMWPWDKKWWKLTTPRRDLVKAGALIVAEIDRLDREETCAND